MATDLAELKDLRDKGRATGLTVTLFYNESGAMDAVYLEGPTRLGRLGRVYDPLSAAEKLRSLTRYYYNHIK
jgi:hypothetical protein